MEGITKDPCNGHGSGIGRACLDGGEMDGTGGHGLALGPLFTFDSGESAGSGLVDGCGGGDGCLSTENMLDKTGGEGQNSSFFDIFEKRLKPAHGMLTL